MNDQTSEAKLFSLELFIARFLRYGVLIASALIFIGWMSQLSFTTDTFATFTEYRHVPLSSILTQAWSNHAWGLLTTYLGLAVLISLPITRVVLTGLVFLIERDFILAACAAVVLCGLVASFLVGALI